MVLEIEDGGSPKIFPWNVAALLHEKVGAYVMSEHIKKLEKKSKRKRVLCKLEYLRTN